MNRKQLAEILRKKGLKMVQADYSAAKDIHNWEKKHGKVKYAFKEPGNEPTVPKWLKQEDSSII